MCWFFHQIAPSGSIRGTLGCFRFFPKIRRNIRQKVGPAVYDTLRNGNSGMYDTIMVPLFSKRSEDKIIALYYTQKIITLMA